MRKIIAILVAILIGFGMVACGKDSTEEKTTKTIDDIFKIAKENMDTSRMIEADAEMLTIVTQLKEDQYDDMRYMSPQTNLNTNEILVIKAKDSEAMEKTLKEYLDLRIELYENYLAGEAEKLKSAELFKSGDYLVLLVGEKASEVKEAREKIEK